MTSGTGTNDSTSIAADALQDLTKRALATQTELSKRSFETFWHWQERIQSEATQLTELFKSVFSTTSAADQIGILHAWIKGVTQRNAQDLIYSIETANALAKVEPQI
ncbi:hypothetical protein RX327_32670 [Bradyrhizobium sp. BEA-2-5]|uniref:hypothetical protein n=1 Tax=Bradyrhizobium sp. BEA-2-5 TaxID=3080015 RepID=UPI00293ED284|nr:hypothetical protein [Bradyrhizobium sp. BEA-2-5]WOH80484.1 hypothetical protein RX327_32670 [Bradyrhizobium sp. BEA-2-5]